MTNSLLAALGDARFVFTLGKGGVGKTTAAGGIGLALAGTAPVHVISVDPAHSLGDLFDVQLPPGASPSPCTDRLTLEEFDARAYADAWAHETAPALRDLLERGTYLESDEAAHLLDLSLPGMDEVMAALRLAELAAEGGDARVVVDTAPWGHTLRLLDAPATVETWIEALRAMADKAVVVATRLSGREVRLEGEAALDRLEDAVRRFRADVLGRAVLVVVTRPDPVVVELTDRLLGELARRGLRTVVLIGAGGPPAAALRDRAAGGAAFQVPELRDPRGCSGLERWRAALRPVDAAAQGAVEPGAVLESESARGRAPEAVAEAPAGSRSPAASWLNEQAVRLVLVAGKGGVGKSTCAAAAALALAETRPVLLCSVDPAGSLSEVLGTTLPPDGAAIGERLRARQVDAGARFEALRAEHRDQVDAAFERLGLDRSLSLDRRVMERLWNLAPPGLDEAMALIELAEAAERDETLVVDAAPTGHFLRLIAMPALALDWVHALMRVLVNVHAVELDDIASGLLRFARRLKLLTSRLTDPAWTGALLVTLDERLVRVETGRLRDSLAAIGVPVAALILNRAGPGPDFPIDGYPRVFAAPELQPPPRGPAALRRFLDRWIMVP